MFDDYYHDKLVEKKILPSQEEEMEKIRKEDLDNQFEDHLRELRACNNIESQLNEQYESIKKAQLKANTPTIKEKGLILEKTNKNCNNYSINVSSIIKSYNNFINSNLLLLSYFANIKIKELKPSFISQSQLVPILYFIIFNN